MNKPCKITINHGKGLKKESFYVDQAAPESRDSASVPSVTSCKTSGISRPTP